MKFSDYLNIKESKEPSFLTSKVKLQKNSGSKEFSPLTVNKSSHSNLRPIIKAFAVSNQVGVGYTTIDKRNGEVEPQLKKKSLYLTGGAVRDHLKGKTPRNYDLVTDASISEIKMILAQSEENFTEIKPEDAKHKNDKKYEDLPVQSRNNKVFFVSKWDKKGKELEVTVRVKGQEFNIAPLSKSSKSRLVSPDSGELAPSIEEDASNRDLTINSLYIPLSSSDGDNSELIDPYGGANHLKNNQIKVVGEKIGDRLKDDPATALRIFKINARYGDPDKLPKNYRDTIKSYSKDIAALPKDLFKKEFISGLENPDVDSRKYMKMANDLDLLGSILPGASFDPQEAPKDFRGDRWLSSAWVLRNNDPESVRELLASNGWTSQEANDIAYLVKLYNWGIRNNYDEDSFYDMKKSHCGLTKSKIKDWMKMAGDSSDKVDRFLDHDDSDLTAYLSDEMGRKSINPAFHDYLGRAPYGQEFDIVKRNLSTNRWLNSLNPPISDM
jgi:tRNA nucleotidyltransferase/poly(A) polymerase